MIKSMKITAFLMCLILLTGCGKQNSGNVMVTSEIEQITFLKCIDNPDLYNAYVVYVITPDQITEYSLTDHWMNSSEGYDFFEEGFPDESEYTTYRYALARGGWFTIVDAFVDNKFAALPEDLTAEGISTGRTYEIEIKTVDGTFRSGGNGAGFGNDKDHERYHEVVLTLEDVLYRAYVSASERGEIITSPQP